MRNMRRFYRAFPIRDALRPELSWTHYRLLMRVENEKARTFYLAEAVKSGWSSRQLARQIDTMFYQRILASRDKESISAEIQTTEPKPEYEKIIKDPYVLEFLDLSPNEHFYESELEQALIDHLQKFLLELGRGFSFVARQKHFNIDGRHFYIDLVFYNYITKCFVLIDLKTGDLTHQDIQNQYNPLLLVPIPSGRLLPEADRYELYNNLVAEIPRLILKGIHQTIKHLYPSTADNQLTEELVQQNTAVLLKYNL